MGVLSKVPSALKPEDLHNLVENRVRESRTLEFKVDYGRAEGRTRRLNDEQKKEFLADVSAFANTAGGDLVIGIREDSGEAAEVVGLDLEDPDEEIRKLDSVLRDSLEPRLPGVTLHSVELENGCHVLVIRAPRSWIGPHRVVANGKFWARNSAGKYPMDVSELRQAFTLADTLMERVRRFRTDRLALISANEAMVPLPDSPKAVLHIIPLSSFVSPAQIQFNEMDGGMQPMGARGGWNSRYTVEGHGTYTGDGRSEAGCHSYTLVFRSGIIEGVHLVANPSDKEDNYVYSTEVEGPITHCTPRFLERLRREAIEGPFYLFFSLLGVKGRSMYIGNHFSLSYSATPVRRDVLLFPEVVFPAASFDMAVVRPLCDMVFNAFGLHRSPSFVSDGKYIER